MIFPTTKLHGITKKRQLDEVCSYGFTVAALFGRSLTASTGDGSRCEAARGLFEDVLPSSMQYDATLMTIEMSLVRDIF